MNGDPIAVIVVAHKMCLYEGRREKTAEERIMRLWDNDDRRNQDPALRISAKSVSSIEMQWATGSIAVYGRFLCSSQLCVCSSFVPTLFQHFPNTAQTLFKLFSR